MDILLVLEYRRTHASAWTPAALDTPQPGPFLAKKSGNQHGCQNQKSKVMEGTR